MFARSRNALCFLAGLLSYAVVGFAWPQRAPGVYPERAYWIAIDGTPNVYGPRSLGAWAAYLNGEAIEGATPALVCFGHAKGFTMSGPYREQTPRQPGGWDVNGWFGFEDVLRLNLPPHAG